MLENTMIHSEYLSIDFSSLFLAPLINKQLFCVLPVSVLSCTTIVGESTFVDIDLYNQHIHVSLILFENFARVIVNFKKTATEFNDLGFQNLKNRSILKSDLFQISLAYNKI